MYIRKEIDIFLLMRVAAGGGSVFVCYTNIYTQVRPPPKKKKIDHKTRAQMRRCALHNLERQRGLKSLIALLPPPSCRQINV